MAAAVIAGSGYALTGLDGDPARGDLAPPPEPTPTPGPPQPPAPPPPEYYLTPTGPSLPPAPPPNPPYTCIYAVVDGEAQCLSLDHPLVKDFEACSTIQFQDRAACLPPDALYGGAIVDAQVPSAVPLLPKEYSYIKRGRSIIWFTPTELLEYSVHPQDQPDFRALKELFLYIPPAPTPPYTCIYMVVDGAAICEPLNGREPFGICPPIQFQGRAACLPPDATHYSVLGEGVLGAVEDPLWPKEYLGIRRGTSNIRFTITELLEYTVLPQDEPDFRALRELFLPAGAAPPPPPYPYNCRYVVVDDTAVCLPLDSALMEGCVPFDFQERSACLPPGIEGHIEYTVSNDPTTGEEVDTYAFTVIRRGNSVIRYIGGFTDELIEYSVAPEDEADFRGLKELFLPGQ